jgi:RNase P/RNase MRP subunit p29
MSQVGKERLFLRQWVGERVAVVTTEHGNYSGHLTNIVFDQGNRLIYIMLDDKQCLNFDHIIEITLSK